MTQPLAPTPDYATATGPIPGIPAPSPLTPEQMAAVKLAHDRSRKIRRAAAVAITDASIMAFFTAVVFVSAIFDWTSIILGIAFTVLTINSFRGAAGLKRIDPAAPRLLAVNQIALAIVIIIYAAYSLYMSMRTPLTADPSYKQIAEMDPAMGDMLQNLSSLIYKALYLGLIAGTIIAQGLTALYYHTRAKLIKAHLEQTPAWIIDLQRQQSAK